jgi:hypothetical protein
LTLESPTTVVTGNLVVQGETTYVSTTDLKVDDPVIELANNNSVSATDIGISNLIDRMPTSSWHTKGWMKN